MKLSIIIPVYNVKPFLQRCLNSVRDDLCDGVEVIVVDDGSTDGSGEICDEYSEYFKIIHKKNGGVCSARNAGMKVAKGEYIAHLDSDDCYESGAIPSILKILDKYSDDVIQFNFKKFKGNEYVPGRYFGMEHSYPLDHLPPFWVLVWNKVYRRSFLEEHNIKFLEGMKYDDDTQFNIQCFRYMDHLQCASDVIVHHHYDNEGSITHTLSREKFISATEVMLNMLREDNPPMVDRIIRERIVFKWSSKQYVRAFGGEP